ncbi:glycosyltransferase family 2 protein [Chloroflexia bacterium SDU3-3]|nr:glycosyltransferase family 2 protein [Chloroflexia bacterium SDU3-3]
MTRPYLSVIVPAYNEEHRISDSVGQICTYLHQQPYPSELVVVDDGSSDATPDMLRQLHANHPELRVIQNEHRGKAVAVRTGVVAARGQLVLFIDADLPIPLEEIGRMVAALEQGADVAIGSREGAGATRVGEPAHRHLMGRCFNTAVRLLLGQGFRDTQCGFKGFQAEAARRLFAMSQLYTEQSPVLSRSAVTAFDVEILFLAVREGMRIIELPVEWHYRPGSKVSPLADSVSLFLDVVRIRWNALRGRYQGSGPAAERVEEATHARI